MGLVQRVNMMSTTPSKVALLDDTQQYEQLITNIDSIVWEMDVRTYQFTFVSQQAEPLLGYPLSQWLTPGFWVDHLDPDDRDCVLENCLRVTRDQRSLDLEYRMTAADGRTVWLRNSVTAIMQADEVTQLRGVMVDMTDHKRPEQTLRASEARFRVLIDNSWEAITLVTAQGTILYASPANQRLWGYSPDEFIGATGFELVHPDDLGQVVTQFGALAQQPGAIAKAQYRIRHKDGSWRWTEAFAHNLLDEPSVQAIVVNAHDITERKHAEEQHRAHLWFLESMDQVNRIIQGTNDLNQLMTDVLDVTLAIFGCDRAWLVYPCDPQASSWSVPMERTRPDFPGAFILRLDIPMDEDIATVLQTLRAASGPVCFGPGANHPLPQETAKRFSIQSQIAMTIYPKIDKPYVFGLHQCTFPRFWTPQEVRLFQEIGRRLADALSSLVMLRNLRESESRFRIFVDHATDAFFLHDGQGTIVDVNRQACEMLGYTAEELIGMTPADFDVDAVAKFQERFGARLAAGEVVAFETHHRRKEGSVFPVEIRIRPFQEGNRNFGVALVRDITERKQAEEALRDSHNLLHAIVEGTSDGIFLKDLQGRYLMINSAGARLFGKEVEEVLGKDDWALFHPDTARIIIEGDHQIMMSGESQVFEEAVSMADVTRTYLTTKGVYRDAHGQVIGLIGISRDVTELKRLEGQFRQAQKMEAVGRLAGGIAHDFNNLLTAITGYADLAIDTLEPHTPARADIEELRKAADRATALTRQLLAFARKQVIDPQLVNLNSLVLEMDKLIRRVIGEDIELHTHLAAELGQVKADPGQIEQVIINVAVNARDAMPEGGKLTIETTNIVLDQEYARAHVSVIPGDYILLTISDTGIGMDSAVQQHLFEPFFTTKAPGKGTGLGLATSYGIVEQHGGYIWIQSEVGNGTRVKIYLPRIDAAAVWTHPPTDGQDWPRGTETILVVEDEASVRKLVTRLLRGQGYTVLETTNGVEALQLAADQPPGAIQLLLTDMVMPQMSGNVLSDQLTTQLPGLKVLFMSGYTDNALVHDGQLDVGVELLPKPFTPAALVRKVRQILDS
jgi:PAS domain S-box-containing protein